MVCEKLAAVVMVIKMTAPGFEPGYIEMCFQKMTDCTTFAKQVVSEMIESSDNQMFINTSRCAVRRGLNPKE